jgi:hypothetical protein
MAEKSDVVLAIEASARITADALVEAAKLAANTVKEGNSNYLVMQNDIGHIKVDVTDIKGRLEGHYVVKEEFDPVKKIVYGLVSIILFAVVGAIVALVVVIK